MGPSSHDLAVEAFERAFQTLQQRQFGRAAELLAQVVNGFPDEKELQERARVYLSICERQKIGRGPTPRSLEERINAATVAINRGAFTEGLTLLRKLETDHRDNDHIQYLMCVAYTVIGDVPHALEHLKLAVALNPENRYLATQDADLDSLRQDAGFPSAIEPAPVAKPAKAGKRR
jgi:predicted Zn-dependent protease